MPAAGLLRVTALSVLMLAGYSCSGPKDESPRETEASLRFSVSEGQAENHFIRQDGISAHLNLRAHPAPRLIVAFPAGNSGAGLFFQKVASGDRIWGSVSDMRTVERTDGKGRALYGLQADIDIEAGMLILDEADVGSIRFLRKAVDYSRLPQRAPPVMHIDGDRIRFTRERPDVRSSYLMEVEVLAGDLRQEGDVRLVADGEGSLKIRVVAASGDPLEMPVPVNRLLATGNVNETLLEKSLAFLTYETKMLAGSWRFLTYFGRDTLLSICLLMPILGADAAEIGLGSVFERINDQGEVAHEEEIGELAVYRNMAERGQATDTPVYDYDMIDDNLLLAPVFASYVDAFGLERADEFLSGRTSGSWTFRSQLVRNLRLVVEQAGSFAAAPEPSNLLAIKDGLNDGNWRDSEEGLVGGRYPYDVNAVLMPAALRAAAKLVGSGLTGRHAPSLPGEQALLAMATVWEANAAKFFRVSVPSVEAKERVGTYARENGYPLSDVPGEEMRFYAVALDARLEPIPVMHSDVAADLLFLQRPESHLREIVTNLTRRFPAGLATRVGVLSANPAFADAKAQALVTRNHYHGTVVWSWQQMMLIAGLDRQLRRDDLSAALKDELRAARNQIWRGIMTSKEIINSELWSYAVQGEKFIIAPFGQSEGHLTESNAIQLWSTVFLALGQNAPTR